MRHLVVKLLCVVGLLGLATVEAALAQDESQPNACRAIVGGDGYSCPWGLQQTTDGSGPTADGAEAGGPTPRVIYVDDIGSGPDGKPCFFSRAVPLGDSDTFSPGTNLGNLAGPVNADYPPCPVAPGAAPAPRIDPRTVAVQGWEEVDLPKPQPYIAPGWAITGKTAYLETRGQLHNVFTKGTPIGPLEIDATARYYVDWGDGDTGGPYALEGGPWPDGQITHTYITAGNYDVTVTEKWSANWQLGSASGQLSGQQTTGGIDGFRVEQVQAVVEAG